VAVEKLFSTDFSARNLACKLLNLGSAQAEKFAEITALVPFSTATPDFTH
jgi:hypothetical protein